MTRRIAYDCEFIEGLDPVSGAPTIDLVSIGLVNIDSTAETLYRVSSEFDQLRLLNTPWLAGHVAPSLPWCDGADTTIDGSTRPRLTTVHIDLNHPDVATRTQIRDQVTDFIVGPGEPVELWADYGAYDHVVLHWLWGGMAGRPADMPMFSYDLQQYINHAGVNPAILPNQAAGLHNALEDARHLATRVRLVDAAARFPRRALAAADPGA